MNYRPDPATWALWDTWTFPDPDGHRIHLFFLANQPRGARGWEWIGHALSEDFIHWQALPFIEMQRPGRTGRAAVVGTGMVFAGPDGDYRMAYTADLDTPRQAVGFMHSGDLVNWEHRWPEPCFVAQPPHYATDPRQAPSPGGVAFRDPFVHRVGDRYEALIGAQSTRGEPLLRAVIARYRSVDAALRHWEPRPPLLGPGVTMLMEVPEYFPLGDRHYLLWSTSSGLGVRCDTPARRGNSGTFYAVSDAYEGPYMVPAENLLIGAGDPHRIHSYVGRTVVWRGERLLYHHHGSPWPAFAFPKRLVQRSAGALELGYWPGLEAAHERELKLPLGLVELTGENIRVGQWRAMGTAGLQGAVGGGGSLALLRPDTPADLHLRCRVTLEHGARFAVTLRDGQSAPGVALQADCRQGEWHFGAPAHRWCSRIDPLETIHEAPQPGRTYQFDLLVRDIYFEAYVDGVWRFSRVIDHHARAGRIGFFVDSGSVRFENIAAWELEPLAHPFATTGD